MYNLSAQHLQAAHQRIKVLVAHGLPVVSAGLAVTLARESRFDLVAAAAPDDVDVVVTDRRGALGWVGRSHRQAPPRVLIVDDSDGEAQVRAAISAGVHGYVLTDCELRELIEGIGQLGRGGRYFCAGIASRIADSLTRETLTRRETDVLSLLVKGHSNKLIARDLGIALGTVKAHAKALFGKLGVRTRSQAVALANERGLVSEAA